MAKIAADLRLLSSGPLGGIADVVLPKVQAGSSIMPGKINPVIPEYVMQLSYRIRGRAATVDMSVAAGELELNITELVIVDSLIDIFHDLSAAARAFCEHCVEGLGLVTAGSRIGSAISTFFLPIIVSGFGVNTVLFGCVGVLVIGGLACWRWAPETRRRSFLEQDAALTAPALVSSQ